MHRAFMIYINHRAKVKFGKKSNEMIYEAIYRHRVYALRGKTKRFADVLVELGILTEDETKTEAIKEFFKNIKKPPVRQIDEGHAIYRKYKGLVQYFIYKYAYGKLPFSPAVDHDDLINDCWQIIIQKVDFKNYHKNAIVNYINKIVKTQCLRTCSKMLHIRIPPLIFNEVRIANKWPNSDRSHEILVHPRNRFVVPLGDNDVITPDDEDNHLINCLTPLLDLLSPKEKIILMWRYGLEKKTLDEVGTILQCTRECVRQIEEKAINKLRQMMLTHNYNKMTSYEQERLRSLLKECQDAKMTEARARTRTMVKSNSVTLYNKVRSLKVSEV